MTANLKVLTVVAEISTVTISRPALVALIVGLALLSSPALLLQFQEPAECMNDVDPVENAEVSGSTPVFQYEELSPDAKRAFDRAQGAGRSVAVYGERCPAEFTYSAGQERYVVVKDETRYVLTTFANDLLPEVVIVAGLLAVLGLVIGGTGVAAYDDEARFPYWFGALGLLTLVAVTLAVVLREQLLAVSGGVVLLTAGSLVGAGAAIRPRRALLLGGVLSILAAAILVPLVGVSLLFLGPAFLPLLLVGVGIGLGRVGIAISSSTQTQ